MSRFIVLALICTSPSVGAAQDADKTSKGEPPKLQPVFSDDFSKDTRGNYRLTGNVSWQQGTLALAEGASITRMVTGGPWAKVSLQLRAVDLTAQQPQSELRVWFHLDEATPCFVRLRREWREGQPAGSVELVDTGEQDGQPTEQVVRQSFLDLDFEQLSVEYRNGLVLVTADRNTRLMAYIRNGSVTVGSVTLQSVASVTGFRNFATAATPRAAREFNAYLYASMTDYARAEPIFKQVLEIRKSEPGERHPDYAVSLNNLAALYESMGDYSSAEPLHKQALDIRRSVLGRQHPDYATSLEHLALVYQSMGERCHHQVPTSTGRPVRGSSRSRGCCPG